MSHPLFSLLGFGTLCCFSLLVHAVPSPSGKAADINWQERLLTQEEAEAIVESRRLAHEAEERRRRKAALSLPALEQRVVDKGEKKIVFRRVAKLPERKPAELRASTGAVKVSPEVLSAWEESQKMTHEQISMAANVYGGDYSEITWRDTETRAEFTVWTNVNLNYLRPIDSFSADGYRYDYFGFIHAYDRESERERLAAAAEAGYPAESRWKQPPVVFSNENFEYFVDAGRTDRVPEKLYRQMDALFAYYLAHREEFEIRHKNAAMLQAARLKSLKERPPVEPKEVIMNYTPLRGENAE
ncbi:MAG: hypothetical protein ACLFVC_00680 [Opitutales bacterium]